MNEIPTLASFQQPTTDAAAKAHQRKGASPTCQASSGDSEGIESDANGGQVSTFLEAHSDPNGTVFIDRDSHKGAWARHLRNSEHGEHNAE